MFEELDNKDNIQNIDEDFEKGLDIMNMVLKKNDISQIKKMKIVPFSKSNIETLKEDDFIDNVRIYKINEMVYKSGESTLDKFSTVYNTLSIYNTSVFMIIDSDGSKTDFYLGVRNNESKEYKKRSTITIGDTLNNALIGHFPGIKINNIRGKDIEVLSEKIKNQDNVASVSVIGDIKTSKEQESKEFVQGLEKLVVAMSGRKYVGLIIAKSESLSEVHKLRRNYQDLYTKLSGYQKVQFNNSRDNSFIPIDNSINKSKESVETSVSGLYSGSMLGGYIAEQLNNYISNSSDQNNNSDNVKNYATSVGENKFIIDMMRDLDNSLRRMDEFDSYGIWNIAGYFVSEDMSTAEMAASNYRSLMNGKDTGGNASTINTWRKDDSHVDTKAYNDLVQYLSRFVHPKFYYQKTIREATISITGKEIGLHLGLPRDTVAGLPVIQHAEFGKDIVTCNILNNNNDSPENKIKLGKVFDLGKDTNISVELNNDNLSKHTFITGSTGSGKSNTVYQILNELRQDNKHFLVIEPAKGEYKDMFGNFDDVNVFSTNPKVAPLLHMNPFEFPDSIHVLEHIDGLIEIFTMCWPMEAAMPAFFKDAILKSYEEVGWDLGVSKCYGAFKEYPDFSILVDQLERRIENSQFDDEVKSNYKGALVTRVKSLTVGLNKYMFTSEDTPYEDYFDKDCIIDISRVKSSESKSLLMGLLVYMLNEYRIDTKERNNEPLKHVTVLEEAHNILKNTSSTITSDLVSKSVEMLTQTIAEIRTFGEGFIIVDQSPTSVDIAAIKNTNIKIVLRTPEANDREAIGKSIGLSSLQMNEIAKLPDGVAVVYQNDWVNPILTHIDKCNLKEEQYKPKYLTEINPLYKSRLEIVKALMQYDKKPVKKGNLLKCVNDLELSRDNKKDIVAYIDNIYRSIGKSETEWTNDKFIKYKKYLKDILDIKFEGNETLEDLKNIIKSRLSNGNEDFNEKDENIKKLLGDICYILTVEEN